MPAEVLSRSRVAGLRPLAPPGRIVGLDIARCIALIGMIATHTWVRADEHGVTMVHQVVAGRSSALFAVIAGVSLALMSGGRTPVQGLERRAVRAGLAGRAAAIFVIGIFLAELPTTIAVILGSYAVLFVLALPFLGLRPGALVGLAAVGALLLPILSHLVRPVLPDRGFAGMHLSALGDPWQLLTELSFTGYYPAVTWLPYLLVGLALGRTDLSRWRTAAVTLSVGAAAAVLSWLGSNALLERAEVERALLSTAPTRVHGPSSLAETLQSGLHGTTPTGSWWWLAVRAPHSGTSFDLAHTIGTSLVVIALALMWGRLLPQLTALVFGAGAMTLSLYTLHVILRTPAFQAEHSVGAFAFHVAVVLMVGTGFRLVRARGPIEVAVSRVAASRASWRRSRDLASAAGNASAAFPAALTTGARDTTRAG